MRSCTALVLGLMLTVPSVSMAEHIQDYAEACDGSAAVALTPTTFLSATDDDNVLRVYDRDHRGPIARYDLVDMFPEAFLHLPKKDKEMDLEGAATLDGTMYLITSHGSDKENRRRLFRTRIGTDGRPEPVGSQAYDSLIKDLNHAEGWEDLKIKDASKKEPGQKGGLNIEGLAVWSDGLLVGFRNPLGDHHKKAVVLQITNLTLEKGQTPGFSKPILLDLGGLGIRSLEYSSELKRFFLIAGPFEKDDPYPVYRLYEWAGPKTTQLGKSVSLNIAESFQPESPFFFPGTPDRAYVLSDDGKRENGDGTTCKDLPVKDRTFRGTWISLP